MDSKGNMPHIKSDVNKVDDKKKSAGLLASLFGGGGSNAGGLGGLGGLGSGAAAGGGGMLATKAGVIALLVIGSAVAGGVGMVGYKIFGPGDSDQVGGNLALFAPKPKEAQADPNAAPPVAKDGASTSLDYMSQAALKDKAADASAAAAGDQTAGGAAAGSSSDASATGASGAINAGSGSKGSLGSMGKAFASGKKMGELSKGGSGGGTSSASASAGAAPVAAGQSGSLGAFKASSGRASSSSGRAIASRIGGSTSGRNQLGSVNRDHMGAASSMAAGTTYDGSAKSGSAIGPNGTAIGMDGSGSGGEAQPKSISKNTAPNANEQTPPIPKPVHVVVPWEKAVQRAQMLVGLAIGLALLSTMLGVAPWAYYAKLAIGAVISMIGAYIVSLGAQVMGGAHGQPLQGSVVIAAGLGTIVMGVMTMFTASDGQAAQTDITSKDYGSLAGPKPAAPTSTSTGTASSKEAGVLSGINPVVLLGGGLAAVSAISLFFAPKPKPVEVPEGQRGPDVSYHQTAPPQNYGV